MVSTHCCTAVRPGPPRLTWPDGAFRLPLNLGWRQLDVTRIAVSADHVSIVAGRAR